MGDEAVSRHHDYFTTTDLYSDFTRIDSTAHSEEETVRAIYKKLQLDHEDKIKSRP